MALGFACKIKVLGKWYAINANAYTPLEITDPEEIKSLEAAQGNDLGNTIGEAQICGFDKVSTIIKKQNGWVFGRAGERETPFSDGYKKPLNSLCPLSDLASIIKGALDLPEGENGKSFAQKRLL